MPPIKLTGVSVTESEIFRYAQ